MTDFNSGTKGKSPLSLVRLGRVVAPALVTITWFALLTVTFLVTEVAALYLPPVATLPPWLAVIVADPAPSIFRKVPLVMDTTAVSELV